MTVPMARGRGLKKGLAIRLAVVVGGVVAVLVVVVAVLVVVVGVVLVVVSVAVVLVVVVVDLRIFASTTDLKKISSRFPRLWLWWWSW